MTKPNWTSNLKYLPSPPAYNTNHYTFMRGAALRMPSLVPTLPHNSRPRPYFFIFFTHVTETVDQTDFS